MLVRTALSATVFTVCLAVMGAQAQDRYPDWSGQWKRPPGAGIQWDQTKRPVAISSRR